MTTRSRHPLGAWCVLICCLAPLLLGAGKPDVWQHVAQADGTVRLFSPTTYVIATHVVPEEHLLIASEATVYIGNWTFSTQRLIIDPSVDAVDWPQE